MDQAVTIGLDIAKSVFQVHGVDAEGAVVMRRRLTRSQMLAFFEENPCQRRAVHTRRDRAFSRAGRDRQHWSAPAALPSPEADRPRPAGRQHGRIALTLSLIHLHAVRGEVGSDLRGADDATVSAHQSHKVSIPVEDRRAGKRAGADAIRAQSAVRRRLHMASLR